MLYYSLFGILYLFLILSMVNAMENSTIPVAPKILNQSITFVWSPVFTLFFSGISGRRRLFCRTSISIAISNSCNGVFCFCFIYRCRLNDFIFLTFSCLFPCFCTGSSFFTLWISLILQSSSLLKHFSCHIKSNIYYLNISFHLTLCQVYPIKSIISYKNILYNISKSEVYTMYDELFSQRLTELRQQKGVSARDRKSVV